MDNDRAPLDLDASPIQGQLASTVMDLEGKIVRGQLTSHDASLLYQMLMESSNVHGVDGFQRMTITFANVRYIAARDDSHIYITKARVV
jgi:hypothetical protein